MWHQTLTSKNDVKGSINVSVQEKAVGKIITRQCNIFWVVCLFQMDGELLCVAFDFLSLIFSRKYSWLSN